VPLGARGFSLPLIFLGIRLVSSQRKLIEFLDSI